MQWEVSADMSSIGAVGTTNQTTCRFIIGSEISSMQKPVHCVAPCLWHQDKNAIMVLLQDTWLNIKANRLAKNKLDQCGVVLAVTGFPVKVGYAWLGSHGLPNNWQIDSNANQWVSGRKALEEKIKSSDHLWQAIDWEGLERVYRESMEPTHQWAIKYTSSFWAWKEYEEKKKKNDFKVLSC